MAAFLCRVCGGALELISGKSLCRCPYCGTMQSVPLLDSEEKAELCARAEQLRREFRYDKAIAVYERLIRLSPTDADLYWALTLCRYGAELSPNGSVSLNRICAHSVLSDEDYKLALKFAGDETRVIMERQAEQIDIARRRGMELAGSAEYDVYICARETDESGRRAMDSVIAAGLYSRLSAAGFKVFSPQKELEDVPAGEWEPHIFAALNSARVMIVVGTNAESFDDVWVRNAWSRFTGTIIPVIKDMPPSDLPDELAKLQVLDMSRLGAENDLISSIAAATGRTGTETAEDGGDPNASLLRRAALFLEDGDFGKAEAIADQILTKSSNNAEAYIIKLLAEYRLPRESALDEMTQNFSDSENYRLAMRYGNEPLRSRLKEHFNKAAYAKFTARLSAAEASGDEIGILAAAAEFSILGNYSNAAELAKNAEKKVADMREKHRGDMYEHAVKALAESDDPDVLRSAEQSLRSLGDYKNAPSLADECAAKTARIPVVIDSAPEDKQKRWNKFIPFAAAGAAALIVVIAIAAGASRAPAPVADSVPAQNSSAASAPTNASANASTSVPAKDEQAEKYEKATALFREGNYDEAELLFTVLGEYKDSAKMVNECKYQSAAALLKSGEFDMAQRAFERLGKYSNSPEMILKCQYQKAQKLLEDGDVDSARAIFKSLNGKWESTKFINQIDYAEAEKLLEAGDLDAAEKAFKALGNYSDSKERVNEVRYRAAAKLMANGDYKKAAAEFNDLGSYSDSRTQYCRAYYNMGLELAAQNKFRDAIAALEEAGSYGDAARQITKVRNSWIRNALNEKNAYFEFGTYLRHVNSDTLRTIDWRVLTVENDMALFYAISPIDYLQFDKTDPNCDWQNSSLRRWLNGEYYENYFTASEKSQICTSVFETASGHYNYIGTSGSGISDKIFLLNMEEAKNASWVRGSLYKSQITVYAQDKLPEDYGTLFNWGRDMPLYNFGSTYPTTSYGCVTPAMWVYIGD